jgi:hypothetical protein
LDFEVIAARWPAVSPPNFEGGPSIGNQAGALKRPQHEDQIMRKLLTTVAVLATFCAPAVAGNSVDKGVATTAIYAKYCDEKAVSPKFERMLDAYLKTRFQQVEAEIEAIMAQFAAIPNLDEVTAMNIWCDLMKPEVARILRGL